MNISLLEKSTATVRNAFPGARPACTVVLGSGWKEMFADFEPHGEIAYSKIECLGTPGVDGHAGRLHWMQGSGTDLFVFDGRRHWYEGDGWEPVVFPAFLAAETGCKTLLLTCAAGALEEQTPTGTLYVVSDHINAMGAHPLVGPPSKKLGPRFPDQQQVYTPALREKLLRCAREQGAEARQGVYAAVSGPTYETPAEAHALRVLGADIAGMSIVPEAMLAHARGVQVAALACIANPAGASPDNAPILHQQAMSVVNEQKCALSRILSAFLLRVRH